MYRTQTNSPIQALFPPLPLLGWAGRRRGGLSLSPPPSQVKVLPSEGDKLSVNAADHLIPKVAALGSGGGGARECRLARAARAHPGLAVVCAA